MSKLLPKAVGPYSAYYVAGDFLYISGQLGINPETNLIEGKSAAEQAKQSLENLKTILELNGLTTKNVVKTLVLLNDINDFNSVNEVYGQYFSEPYPARSAFQVGKLPKEALVEIEAIAYLK